MLLLFWMLAAYGMTTIIVYGSIFESFRDWVIKKSTFFGKLITCILCTSTWVGFFFSVLFMRESGKALPAASIRADPFGRFFLFLLLLVDVGICGSQKQLGISRIMLKPFLGFVVPKKQLFLLFWGFKKQFFLVWGHQKQVFV